MFVPLIKTNSKANKLTNKTGNQQQLVQLSGIDLPIAAAKTTGSLGGVKSALFCKTAVPSAFIFFDVHRSLTDQSYLFSNNPTAITKNHYPSILFLHWASDWSQDDPSCCSYRFMWNHWNHCEKPNTIRTVNNTSKPSWTHATRPQQNTSETIENQTINNRL